MMYSDFYTRQPRIRIPVLVPFLIGVLVLSFFIWRSTPTPATRADAKKLVFVQTANVFPHQITIVWQTESKEQGWLLYGASEQDLINIAPDDRDVLNANKVAYQYHIATLYDLKENTRYYFHITNGREILGNTSQSVFTVKTISSVNQVNSLKPAYGRVLTPGGSPAVGVIIVLSARNTYPLAAVSKSSGEWLIPLNYTIDKSSANFRPLSLTESITLYFFDSTEKESKVIAKVSQLSPLSQSIELGKSYSLTEVEKVLAATDKKTLVSNKIDIIYPKDNAVISAARPLIKGTGAAGKQVAFTIINKKTSEQIYKQSKVVARDNTWDLNLKYIFEPATYLLNLSTTDTENKKVTLSRTFTITKSGEQVLATATPSATLTPTLIPTSATTQTPTPTTILLPTLTPTPTTTQPIVQATATPVPPVSGGGIYPLVISSIALILFGAGLLVVF